ncbi:hypothetical protein [Vibrio vulnificus]|uniref:hypothetical protein n=1 Tax=Vibrio vulnificus TaxID=672 RepID=UPI0011852A93|nr:hypothetical protein [Vibrio vulnificus]
MDRPDQLIFQIGITTQSFADYEDIVSKVCRAWNSFLEYSARVRQMCSRRWIDLTSYTNLTKNMI